MCKEYPSLHEAPDGRHCSVEGPPEAPDGRHCSVEGPP